MKQTERLNNQCMTRLRNDDGFASAGLPTIGFPTIGFASAGYKSLRSVNKRVCAQRIRIFCVNSS